jgi:hypothetical protein
MSHSQTLSAKQNYLAKLTKLYANKCLQAEKAKAVSNSLMYQVLKAEADNIKTAIDQY